MSFVKIKDKQFTIDGQSIQFRGLNLGNWMLVEHYMIGLPWTEYQMRAVMRRELGEKKFHAFWDTFMDESLKDADFRFMSECGFNWMQLPINYRHFLKDGTASGFDQRGYEYVDRVIALCKKYNIYLLLSLHAAPGAQVRDWNAESAFGEAGLWDHEHLVEQTERFWLEFAERYKDEEIVAGYEILNEPVAGDLEQFNAFNRRMLKAIRSVDKNHIVGIAFNNWNRDFDSLAPDLYDDPQVTGIFHHYIMQHGPFSKLETYPGEYEGKHYGPEELLAPLLPSIENFPYDRPLICGELGVPNRPGQPFGTFLKMKNDLLEMLEDKNVSWTAWAYKDLGVLGLVQPESETPWRQFLTRPEVKRLGTDTYRKAFKAYWKVLKEDIPDLDAEDRSLFITQTKHTYDSVMLPKIIEYMKSLTAEDLREMAMSFAFENCVHIEGRVELYGRFCK